MSTDVETQSPFSCKHCVVLDGFCFHCEMLMEEDYGTAFEYLAEGCRLSNESVQFMRQINSEISFHHKKLHVVLDLDRTLLHTCRVTSLKNQEKYLIEQAGSRKDLRKVTLSDYFDYLVKFRPFVNEFLSKASELFEMHVYTMGSQEYAETVVSLLDPQDIYFRQPAITRADSPHFKTLDLVLAEQHGIVIIDDTPEAWPDHWWNLITIEKYNYFHETTKGNVFLKSYSEEKTDESETDGPLADILLFLEKIHGEFFQEETDSRDVRVLI